MVKPYLPTITVSISREFDGEVCDVRKVSVCLNSIDADRFEDALDMVIDGAQSHARVQPTVETTPSLISKCRVCGKDWGPFPCIRSDCGFHPSAVNTSKAPGDDHGG